MSMVLVPFSSILGNNFRKQLIWEMWNIFKLAWEEGLYADKQ